MNEEKSKPFTAEFKGIDDMAAMFSNKTGWGSRNTVKAILEELDIPEKDPGKRASPYTSGRRKSYQYGIQWQIAVARILLERAKNGNRYARTKAPNIERLIDEILLPNHRPLPHTDL